MNKDFIQTHRNSLIALLVLVVAFGVYYSSSPKESAVPNSHLEHMKMLAEIKRGSHEGNDYSVSLSKPVDMKAGVPVSLSFEISDSNGNPSTDFEINNEKILHLIIVNDALTYFDHVHPEFDGKKFIISHTFPKDDAYRLYFDFKPKGMSEKQASVALPIGNPSSATPKPSRDMSLTKTFGAYTVGVDSTFKSEDIIKGTSHLVFTVTDSKTGAPVKDLRPYLGAFGHLVMINEDTHEYIHAHPINQPLGDDRSGPTVDFLPINLQTGTLDKGRYRLFAQIQPTSGLFTADFTVDIK